MTEKRNRKKPAQQTTEEPTEQRSKKEVICSIIKKKTKEKFLSESQKIYYNKLIQNQITDRKSVV